MARLPKVRWNTKLVEADMVALGWGAARLATEAGLAVSTVTRWLNGPARTAKTGKRIALAMGHPVSRYVHQPKSSEVAA